MSDYVLYCRTPEIIARNVGDECVLVPVTREAGDLEYIFTLNPVAAHLWACLETPRSADALVEALLEAFDVEREEAERDVQAFLDDLEQAGLARHAEGATS